MKTKYLVMMNLAGLHRCVYKCYWQEELKTYYDKSGNVSCGDRDEYKEGIVNLVFDNEKEAKAALKGAKMVADMLIRRLE